MPTYEEIIAKTISIAIPASAPAPDPVQYYGQVGDFFGGFWGTIIGVITLLVVFATWYSARKIDARSKIYQVFAEILRTHEEIVTSLRLGSLVGREAFSEMLSEFYVGYSEISTLEAESKIILPIDKRINAAFLLMYYGAHPQTVAIINESVPELDAYKICERISVRKRSNIKKIIFEKLGQKLDGDPADRAKWNQSIRDSFRIIRTCAIPADEKSLLLEVLNTAQTRPHSSIDKHKIVKFIENFEPSSEFGGHKNRLSHYFRNLYSAFSFIDDQRLSKREKYSLSKVLRSKLSNYEQALLALNALSEQGASWIESGLISKYMPIKNIPKHFFTFDSEFNLKTYFPTVTFEWENTSSVTDAESPVFRVANTTYPRSAHR